MEVAFWPFSLEGLGRTARSPEARAEWHGRARNPGPPQARLRPLPPQGGPGGYRDLEIPARWPRPSSRARDDFDPPPTLGGPAPSSRANECPRARAPAFGPSVSVLPSHFGPSLLFHDATTSFQTQPLPPLVFTAPTLPSFKQRPRAPRTKCVGGNP